MTVTNISEAKAQLSALIERVLAGEEIVIGKAGKPVAKLVPFERPSRPRVKSAEGTVSPCEVVISGAQHTAATQHTAPPVRRVGVAVNMRLC